MPANKKLNEKCAQNLKRDLLRQFWESQESESGVKKHETGIIGFDEMLEGGVPEGRSTLVISDAGCGKTVLLNEFIYRGVTLYDEPGVFLTFEEKPQDIIKNSGNFDWNLAPLISSNQVAFIDATLHDEGEFISGPSEWLVPILARLKYIVENIGAKRLAVDNLGAVFLRYEATGNRRQFREQLLRFCDAIKQIGITTLISTEHSDSEASLSRFGVAEFVSDALIELSVSPRRNTQIRHIIIRKMRGCSYRSGRVNYEITSRGFEVYPKIPMNTRIGETDFDVREIFGIPALDKSMGGGVPQGHILMLAGNTGTGKTTFALHFVSAGLEKGQSIVWVALEEPVKQLEKTASSYGWDLKPAHDNGTLTFVTSYLLDTIADKLLYQIIDAVNMTGARRIIIDSISSLESATMDKESVREFLIQLAGFAKTQGITVVLNYLSGETFGAGKEQLLGATMTNDMRLSSIVDGVILLRYVEDDQEIKKLLAVLKLRGSEHTKDILNYEITSSGIKIK